MYLVNKFFAYELLAVCILVGHITPDLNAQDSNDQWYLDSYRKLFFDYHTYQAAKDVAIHFDAEKWADQLQQSHVQAVSIHSLCHHGWRYYRKGSYGYIHPKLPEGVDIVGQTMEACHKRGIKVIPEGKIVMNG